MLCIMYAWFTPTTRYPCNSETLRPFQGVITFSKRLTIIISLPPTTCRSANDLGMSYQYLPLAKGQQIRLLEIKPLRDPTASPFSLQTYNLSCLPPYEAISYTWGHPGFDTSITCDGKRLPITNNCATMLHYLRLEAAWARRVWIDQICINQGDIPERNDQILLMTEIYSRAQQVVAWIGECSPAEKRCLDLVARFTLTDDLQEAAERLTCQWEEDNSIETSAGIDMSCLESPEVKPWLDDELQEILDCIVARQYFGRMWILQEVTVARRVTVKCGECSFDMERLFDLVSFNHGLRRSNLFVSTLGIYRGQYLEHGTMDWNGFQATFDWTTYHSAADLKDKVYALRGICKTLRENTPPPDYDKSDVEVFIETAKASNITDKGRLTILSAERSPRHGADLPTWCPDYGLRGGDSILNNPSRRLLEKSERPNSLPVIEGNSLIVRGKIIDSIASLSGETLLSPRADQSRLAEHFKIWHVRPASEDERMNAFTVVGSCYVRGLTEGEMYPSEDSDMREIIIV
ncbi:Heterokaryon incompatibility protein 6, OR allele [Cytospora mali]|uniref:Heterokaryon incompatibility protein 6, OR allele n=1 Tax=Cytospora mali TaxID=578113 RepID=A0A194VST8_CYTMA|nr:Heterokaryon incompatibility protein 6, OR allele [Valsa mali]